MYHLILNLISQSIFEDWNVFSIAKEIPTTETASANPTQLK